MGSLLRSRRRKGLIEEVTAVGSVPARADLATTVLLPGVSPPSDSLTPHNERS